MFNRTGMKKLVEISHETEKKSLPLLRREKLDCLETGVDSQSVPLCF